MAEGFKVADGYVDIHGEPDRESGRRAAIVVSEAAEDEGRSRSRRFFAALFTPDADVVQALRTGIPAVLSSPVGLAALTLGGLFAASFVSAVIAGLSLGALGGAFLAIGALALSTNETIVTSFNTTLETIKTGLAEAAAPLIPAFEDAFAIIGNVFTNEIQPLLMQIFTGLAPVIEPLVTAVGDAIVTFLEAIADPAVLGPLTDFFIAIAPTIPQIAEAMGEFFTILSENAGIIAEAFTIAIAIINTIIVVMANVLVFFSGVLIDMKRRWDEFWNAAKTLGEGFINWVKTAWEGIKVAFGLVVEFVKGRVEAVKQFFSSAKETIARIWATLKENIINPIRDGITNAITFIRELPGRAVSAIGNIGRTLWNAGKNLIQGFIDGVKSMFGAVGNAVSDVVGAALDFLPFSPVKKGPLVVFNQLSTNPGAKLARMLAEGFHSQMRTFVPAPLAASVGNVTVNPAISNPPISVRVLLDGREIAPTVYAVADERDLQIKRAVTSGGSRLP